MGLYYYFDHSFQKVEKGEMLRVWSQSGLHIKFLPKEGENLYKKQQNKTIIKYYENVLLFSEMFRE